MNSAGRQQLANWRRSLRRSFPRMHSPAIVGCCGWTEAQSRYFQDFPVIEIQTTFYQPPAVAVAKRWKAQAPAGFEFCIKAWQLIPHTPASPTYRRLKAGI